MRYSLFRLFVIFVTHQNEKCSNSTTKIRFVVLICCDDKMIAMIIFKKLIN